MNAPINSTLLAVAALVARRELNDSMTPLGRATVEDGYLLAGETPHDGYLRACRAWSDDEAHATRLYEYICKDWFMFASPVLSNAPVRTSWVKSFEENFHRERFADGKFRGMPISCFLNMPGDSRDGLTGHYTENAWLSSIGGGIGGYWGGIRSNGTKTSGGSSSSGVIPFLKVVDSQVLAFSQGETRRGSYAAYLDINHPEIVEFLEMRKPTGGDVHRKCLNLHQGINIPDSFMEVIEACVLDANASDDWELIDPHTKKVVEVVSAKALWQRIIYLRATTGEPYLHFIDASNRALPESQRLMGLRVNQSNLCSEITLATSEDRTAVCCLSSINVEKSDEWEKHPLFVEDLVRMLDNVLEFFIQHAPAAMHRAVYSAKQERSIGLGQMGLHSYFQANMLPFESGMAVSATRRIASNIHRKAKAATLVLGAERGECPDAMGSGVRNMHLIAIAPNASSSNIIGTSPSNEPWRANAFTQKTKTGSWLQKNRHLEALLEDYGFNTDEVWTDILANEGSVQHLPFLSDDEKAVFRTAMEINQSWIIEHAAHRQGFVCQAQSVNVFFRKDASIAYLHKVHFDAWKKRLKSMYYLRSEAARRADKVSVQITRAEIANTAGECLSCHG